MIATSIESSIVIISEKCLMIFSVKAVLGEHAALGVYVTPGKPFLIKGKKLPKIILFDSFIFDSEHKVVFAVPMTIFKKIFQSCSLHKRPYVLEVQTLIVIVFLPWHGWGCHKSTLRNIL